MAINQGEWRTCATRVTLQQGLVLSVTEVAQLVEHVSPQDAMSVVRIHPSVQNKTIMIPDCVKTLSQIVNRSEAQESMLFEFCGQSFLKLLELEAKIKRVSTSFVPANKQVYVDFIAWRHDPLKKNISGSLLTEREQFWQWKEDLN